MADDESDAQDDLFQEAIEKFRSQLIEQDLEDEEDSIIMQNFLKPQSKNPLQRSQQNLRRSVTSKPLSQGEEEIKNQKSRSDSGAGVKTSSSLRKYTIL